MKIIDLSLPMGKGMPVFPGTDACDISYSHNIEQNTFKMGHITLNSHAGTHCDAPAHFLLEGEGIEHWKLERCVGEARVLDFSKKAPRSEITVEDMLPYEKYITPGVKLLIRTDWDLQHGKDCYFKDYPCISVELARWLVQKQVGMVGLDAASLNDRYPDVVHQTMLRGDIFIVESLANLREIPDETIFFVGAPLNFKDADGCSVRAMGIIF